jgi:hypothetical protein
MAEPKSSPKRPQTGIFINNKLINGIAAHSNKNSQIFKSYKSNKKAY